MRGRLVILCGPFGVGKSEIAIGLARHLARAGERPLLVDLDVVTPYFRPREVADELATQGVRVVSPKGEAAFLDLPAVPGGLRDLMGSAAAGDATVVVDLGGEGEGAQVLGSLRDALTNGTHWDMLFVVNPYRPDSRTAGTARRVMERIKSTCRVALTGLVANPNLKQATTAETVAHGMSRVDDMARELALPVRARCVAEGLVDELLPPLPRAMLTLSLALLLPFESAPGRGCSRAGEQEAS